MICEMPKLNVLIAGSTGYIGVQLIKLLIEPSIMLISNILCGNNICWQRVFLIMINYLRIEKITKNN